MDYCFQCKWFADAKLHNTYVSPRCTVRGDDDCAYVRSHVCGVDDAILYEPKEHESQVKVLSPS